MAMSTCVKCGNHNFEMVEADVETSSFKTMFIQCSSCGGVVGTTDYYNTPSLLEKIAKKMGFDLHQ